MAMPATDIAEAHRAFGTPDDVLFRRRALYSATIEAATAGADVLEVVDTDVLDSPLARGHLGEVLSGREQFSPAALVPLSELGIVREQARGSTPRIASCPAVRGTLDRVLQEIAARVGAPVEPVMLPDSPGFGTASEQVVEGVSLLQQLSPELAEDVLPHIALVAIVPANRRLGSASFRELPGLVVLPEPQSAFEVTEALVHEGAHQRYFDMGVTCSLLRASAFDGPSFRASWSPVRSPGWPIEQCLAAFHAYKCLAALELACVGSDVDPHEFSLLPQAHDRSEEIATWLRLCDEHLGDDGSRLLDLMTGEDRPRRASRAIAHNLNDATAIRECGDRTLVAFAGNPIRLVWQPVSSRPTDSAVSPAERSADRLIRRDPSTAPGE